MRGKKRILLKWLNIDFSGVLTDSVKHTTETLFVSGAYLKGIVSSISTASAADKGATRVNVILLGFIPILGSLVEEDSNGNLAFSYEKECGCIL